MTDQLKRLDDALDQVETLVVELGLDKSATVDLCTRIQDLWSKAKRAVEENTK